MTLECVLDMRYRGQSYELAVPYNADFVAGFHAAHKAAYGYARPTAPIEIVNVRLRVIGRMPVPTLAPLPLEGTDPTSALLESRPVMLDTLRDVPFYRAEALRPGNKISGPAIVVRADTTVLLDTSDHGSIDAYQNLLIHVG